MSEKLTLNKEDSIKILKGAAIAIGGALLTYVAEVVTKVDFGEWTPVVAALAAVVVNVGRKFLQRV